MQSLTHTDFKKMLLTACAKIAAHKQEINSINVFPVADQDTGSNLKKTVDGIETALKTTKCTSLQSLTDLLLDTALLSAQGNSGMILTGFFQGFFNAIKDKETVTIQDLAKAFQQAAIKAKESIENPVKGTILDVIDATADTFTQLAKQTTDIEPILYKTLQKATEALQETTNKMDLLKQSHVVDAGGLGFLLLLEGFYECISGKTYDDHLKITTLPTRAKVISIDKNKFEVIFIIKDCSVEKEQLMEMLAPLGDSIDILQTEDKLKSHIHTDQPDTVKEIAHSLGEMLHLQIMDMSDEHFIEKQ